MKYCPYCNLPYAPRTLQDQTPQQIPGKPRVDVNNIMSTCNQVMSTVSQANQLILSLTRVFR